MAEIADLKIISTKAGEVVYLVYRSNEKMRYRIDKKALTDSLILRKEKKRAIGRLNEDLKAGKTEIGVEKPRAPRVHELEAVDGIDKGNMDLFIDAGYKTIESLTKATMSDLTTIHGVGNKTAAKIMESVAELIGDEK